MWRAQAEFDARAGPVCPEQLAAPVLHSVIHHPELQVGSCGAEQHVP